MIKNLKNLFKPPAKRREKENDDPFLLAKTAQYGRRMGRSGFPPNARRVNFHGQGRNFDIDQDSEDGGSETTLTTTANEPHQSRQPPNPYSIVTEPKRNRGPRSCPGGRMMDIDEELCHQSVAGAGGGSRRHQQPFIDDSPLDTRSEFIAPQQHQQQRQHRRSCRRRAVPAATGAEHQQQQQPFRDIGNNGGGRAITSHRMSVNDFYARDGHHHASSSSSSRYKNVPLPMERRQQHGNNNYSDDESGTEMECLVQRYEMLKRAYQEEKANYEDLMRIYQEEKARRKELQKMLKTEQKSNEQLQMQIQSLVLNFGLLARQQQQPQNAVLPPNFPNYTSDLLSSGSFFGGQQNTWTGSTPSSSNAVPSTPAARPIGTAHPWHTVVPLSHQQFPPPNTVQPQQQRSGAGGGGRDAGESLATMFSAVSIEHPPFVYHRREQSAPPPPIPPREQHNGVVGHVVVHRSAGQRQQQQLLNANGGGGVEEEDELKDFRRGQHNTDSFSGSSRPTTGEMLEIDQMKEDLVTDSSKDSHHNTTPADDNNLQQFPTNFSSLTTPEAARATDNGKNATFLSLSFSADTICAAGGAPFTLADSPPPPKDDDGYATSETNTNSNMVISNVKVKMTGMQRSQSAG
ncbi:hypothetical protein GPALN_001819 [Globodera pallida]|nr:hypothetical protein GPALN_001819 [Globodera pallida]